MTDRGATAFMMSNLSVQRRGGRGGRGRGEVRSLGADEIKRDDLAIHASSGVGRRTRFGYTFWVEPRSVQHYDEVRSLR